MRRLDSRIDAAISRASRRFFGFATFMSPKGVSLKVSLVKLSSEPEETTGAGQSVLTRRYAFLVGRSAFDMIVRIFEAEKPGKTLSEWMKDATIVYRRGPVGVDSVYRFDASTPFRELSPDDSSVTFFVYHSIDDIK